MRVAEGARDVLLWEYDQAVQSYVGTIREMFEANKKFRGFLRWRYHPQFKSKSEEVQLRSEFLRALADFVALVIGATARVTQDAERPTDRDSGNIPLKLWTVDSDRYRGRVVPDYDVRNDDGGFSITAERLFAATYTLAVTQLLETLNASENLKVTAGKPSEWVYYMQYQGNRLEGVEGCSCPNFARGLGFDPCDVFTDDGYEEVDGLGHNVFSSVSGGDTGVIAYAVSNTCWEYGSGVEKCGRTLTVPSSLGEGGSLSRYLNATFA